MPTQADFARRWNLSRQRLSQMVQAGMPLGSYRAAERWRAAQASKRAPTNGKFAVEHEEGLEPQERKPLGRPLKKLEPSKTGDSLLDALNNAVTVSERAFEAVEKALRELRVSALSPLLSVHNKALEARFMAEKCYREEMERRGLLVDKAAIIEMCRRTMDPVLRRLKKLPQEKGPECNPENPIIAVGILEAEVNSIIGVGLKSLQEAMKEGQS